MQLLVTNPAAPAGALLPDTVTVGEQNGLVQVPMLTHSLPQYRQLTPAPRTLQPSGQGLPRPLQRF